jgi:NAD(P)-dependent dehydrogenase (short-subunit alcohol dehydrogenase family)
MNDLKGRTAFVTGGASGIGEATALLFAEYNCNVVISDLQEQKGNQLVEKIRQANCKAIFIKADVSIPKDCEMLVNKPVSTFGSLDIAFNNAGIGGESNAVADMSIEGWRKVNDVNLNSVFYCMKNASIEQRIKWHLEHLKHCDCRTDLPAKLKEEMKKRKIKVD